MEAYEEAESETLALGWGWGLTVMEMEGRLRVRVNWVVRSCFQSTTVMSFSGVRKVVGCWAEMTAAIVFWVLG